MKRREFNKSMLLSAAVAAAPGMLFAAADDKPRITGPMTGGKRGYPFTTYYQGNIKDVGYVEEEYFMAGRATSYQPQGELTPDGKWRLAPNAQQDYRTRFLVRRPADPSRFNGTVLVEWLNVTAGYDLEITGAMSKTLYDSGCVYVLATCQRVGIEGAGDHPQGLRQWDPERYGSLNIADDSISFDILSQVGRVVGPQRAFSGVDPLAGLKPDLVLATGASQSAGRLRGYINGVHPLAKVYDGFMPTIDFGLSFGFENAPLTGTAAGAGPRFVRTRIRDDISVPVFVVTSESESLMYFPSRQADSSRYRHWEVAGASHAPGDYARLLDKIRARDGLIAANQGYGSEVMWEPTADAALTHLMAWSKNGKLPPTAPEIDIEAGDTPTVLRDQFGNARGGIRLPELEVPIATYTTAMSGFNSPLGLRGKIEPFSDERLRELYPSREDYVAKVTRAAGQCEKDGYIEAPRVAEYIEQAKRTPLGR